LVIRRVYGDGVARSRHPLARSSTVPAYARAVDFAKALVAVVALLIVLPLAIIGLALLGPAGWITAAVVLPLATLATILWLGRARPGDGEPPGRRPE
jgi:uncharacterized RDD family membrane protein YckC